MFILQLILLSWLLWKLSARYGDKPLRYLDALALTIVGLVLGKAMFVHSVWSGWYDLLAERSPIGFLFYDTPILIQWAGWILTSWLALWRGPAIHSWLSRGRNLVLAVVGLGLLVGLVQQPLYHFARHPYVDLDPAWYQAVAIDGRITPDHRYGIAPSQHGTNYYYTENVNEAIPTPSALYADYTPGWGEWAAEAIAIRDAVAAQAPSKNQIELVYYAGLIGLVSSAYWLLYQRLSREKPLQWGMIYAGMVLVGWSLGLLPLLLYGYGQSVFEISGIMPGGGVFVFPSIHPAETVSYRSFLDRLLYPAVEFIDLLNLERWIYDLQINPAFFWWATGMVIYSALGMVTTLGLKLKSLNR